MKLKKFVGILSGLAMAVAMTLSSMPLPALADEVVDIPTSSKDYSAGRLTDKQKFLYDELKKMMIRVTNGYQDSTSVQIPIDDLIENGAAREWTFEELGLSEEDIVDGELTEAASDRIAGVLGLDTDFEKALYALINDCPYEMFWYGIEFSLNEGGELKGNAASCNFIGVKVKEENGKRIASLGNDAEVQFRINVIKSYQSSNGDKYCVDAQKVSDAVKSLNYAKQIVYEAKDMSDYDKLCYYAKTIADNNVYNYDAYNFVMGYDSDSDGSYEPWQIVYVFDQNPETNVVCEGYAKSFKYLCDLTDFDSDDIRCITVSGLLISSGTPVQHMYNIVHMDDGRNYVLDLTACDQDELGIFFDETCIGSTMVTASADGYYGGYVFNDGNIIYFYNEDTWNLYDEGELKVSDVPYIRKAAEVESVDLTDTDTIPASEIKKIAENDKIMEVKVDKDTFVSIDGSGIDPSEAFDIKLVSGEAADGNGTLAVRCQNVDKNIVIYRYIGLDKIGGEAALYLENADKSLTEFGTSSVHDNGFAAFEVPLVNANYKVALK